MGIGGSSNTVRVVDGDGEGNKEVGLGAIEYKKK